MSYCISDKFPNLKLTKNQIRFLSLLDYWLSKCGRRIKYKSGFWIYNTLHEWSEQLGCSLSTTKRIVYALKKIGVLQSVRANAHRYNQTTWYSIEYSMLNELALAATNTVMSPQKAKKRTNPEVHFEQIITNNNYTLINSSNSEEEGFEDFIQKDSNGDQDETTKKAKTGTHHIDHANINPNNTLNQMINIWNSNVPNVQITSEQTTTQNLEKPIEKTVIKKPIKLLELFKTRFGNNLDSWALYAKKVASSGYLMGRINKGFKPQFAFLTRKDVIQKVQRGEYGVMAGNLEQQETLGNIAKNTPDIENQDETLELACQTAHEPCNTRNSQQEPEAKEQPATTNKPKAARKATPSKRHLLSQEEKQTLKTMEEGWNEAFKHSASPIPFYTSCKNQRALLQIWKNHFDSDIEKWRAYALSVNSSTFLMGEKKKSFKANFSWLIQEETIQRIQGGDYGIGDRELDMNKQEENRTKKTKDIANAVTEKLSSIIQKEQNKDEFNHYLISKRYQDDGDKYGLSRLIHPMVSTVSIVQNTDYKHMYNHLYDSYVLKKHGNVSLADLKSDIIKKLSQNQDMVSLRAIEYKVRTTEVLTTMAAERLIGCGL